MQYNKNKKGFTVIELLVVIAIFVVFAGLGEQAFFSFQSKSNLEIATNNVVEALRHAKSNAQQVQGDTKWGIKINANEIIVFSGDSYALRNMALDQSISLTSGISPSGLSEVVFEKVSGKTLGMGTITLTGKDQIKDIIINSYGIINYEESTTPIAGCTGTPWGDVSTGYSNTAYENSSVIYPISCVSENRICTNGTLSGTYVNTSCLVVDYPMSKWSFDEGSGCVANDLYGTNNGVLGNNCPTISPSWVAGKTGNALSFNGSSNNVSISDSVNLNFTTSMSVSAWIKWDINPSSGMAYATIVNKNGDSQYRLQHNSTNSRFEFGIKTNTGGTYVTSSTSPIIGTWYHLVGTWDGALIKIYVNGNLEQTLARSGIMPASTFPCKIGSSSINARWFSGIIDEVNLWNRALSQEEITQIYSSNL